MPPSPTFTHLIRLTDDTGVFEHARHAIVRRAHGYCTDDVARGLVVTCREPDPPPPVAKTRLVGPPAIVTEPIVESALAVLCVGQEREVALRQPEPPGTADTVTVASPTPNSLTGP